ncbi:MAG: hypothetical protein KatS3mg051_0592 [Anaerolineae bacterium]|nr:MAG: hypothetical protein KatS3mg051_0592 [Anaerolineae bacterium]
MNLLNLSHPLITRQVEEIQAQAGQPVVERPPTGFV